MRTNPHDLADDGNRAGGGTLMPPLRERHPEWFGKRAFIEHLEDVRVRRIARNPREKFSTHIVGSSMFMSQRSFTRRELALIASRYA